MKKLLIIALAAVLCLAFTLPAAAKIRIGGRITTDFSWSQENEERTAGSVEKGTNNPVSKQSETVFSMPRTMNRLNARYSNDDESLIGVIELRGGADGDDDLSDSGHWNYAYVMWRINPMWRLQIGQQAQTFGIYAGGPPGTGWQRYKRSLVGFGNVHGGSTRTAFKVLAQFSDMIRMEFQLLDPDGEDVDLAIPADPGVVGFTGANAREENQIPRIDISLPITLPNFKIEPSFTWLKQEYDQVAPGNDDSFDIWGLCVGFRGGFGPLALAGEVTFGDNLGAGNYNNGTINPGQPTTYLDNNALTRIADSEVLAFWFDVGYKFGPASIHGAFGWNRVQNDGDPSIPKENGDAAEIDRTNLAYGIYVPINVAKGWTITPEYVIYDYGTDEFDQNANGLNEDFGKQSVLGVRFMLRF
jgi:opacity protein-like surface antigen